MSLRAIAKQIGCSHSGIDVMLRGQSRAARPVHWTPRVGNLTTAEREQILLGLGRSQSMSEIARALGRSPSTVTREVKANGGRDRYRIWPAHDRAHACTKRPKSAKMENKALCAEVTTWLQALWSLEEITNRLALDYPDDKKMQVSHETIYQTL